MVGYQGVSPLITIGIDPDSQAHGVAVYEGKKLVSLHQMDTPAIVSHITNMGQVDIQFSIENVLANNFVFVQKQTGRRSIDMTIGRKVGMAQQSQTELMRWLDKLEIPYQLHKPQKGNWAKNKEQFKQVTGWEKRSNEDTRSAAFFGYLAL